MSDRGTVTLGVIAIAALGGYFCGSRAGSTRRVAGTAAIGGVLGGPLGAVVGTVLGLTAEDPSSGETHFGERDA
jgi:hypothetical protein